MNLLAVLFGVAWFATSAFGASLQRVTNFGNNPTNMNMYVYVPDRVATNPAIVVAMHPCGGNANQYFSMTKLPSYADQYGFVLIYPEANHNSNCFDTATDATLHHNSGGDSLVVVSMVNYALTTYKADKTRVFALGSSSGAMMTNTVAGSYPDVFAAGASYSGFAFSCLQGGGSSVPSGNTTCASGRVTHTGAEWAQRVYNAYPGYTGPWPRMQIWSGSADTLVVYPQTFDGQINQWATVHGVSFTRNVTNTPSSGFTQVIYGDGTQVVGYVQNGGGHFTPMQEVPTLTFFGIIGGTSSTTSSTTTSRSTTTTTSTTTSSRSTTTTTTSRTTTSTVGGCTVSKYGQCGGQGFSGCTICAAGSTCTLQNAWYSQCL